MEHNPNLTLYLLVRTDMNSMRYGKGVAQGAHAANQFTEEHVIQPLLNEIKPTAAVMDWRTQAKGFGTTITLDVASLTDMQAVVDAANELGFPAGVVTDETYPYIVDREMFALIPEATHTDAPIYLPAGQMLCFREEQTTAYVFGDKNELAVLLKRFNLLPND